MKKHISEGMIITCIFKIVQFVYSEAGSRYSVWLRAGRQRSQEFESRQGQECPLLHVIQIVSRVHLASYTMGIGASFPGGKAAGGGEADHSPPTNAEVKKMDIYTSTPPYAYRDNFTFLKAMLLRP
jgi:hypothetical protein